MRGDLSISVRSPATADEVDTIDQGLGEFNDQQAALSDVRPLHLAARYQSGEIVGGAIGRTWGQCCELRQIWVNARNRRNSIGKSLMASFEVEAKSRGCVLIYPETFSFQAPDFYLKLGYSPVLVTRGFTRGVVKYSMQKSLSAHADA